MSKGTDRQFSTMFQRNIPSIPVNAPVKLMINYNKCYKETFQQFFRMFRKENTISSNKIMDEIPKYETEIICPFSSMSFNCSFTNYIFFVFLYLSLCGYITLMP